MSEKENKLHNNLGTIAEVPLSQVVKKSYIDYSMSVIVSRALPDVRDGLKPVHRRILYGMAESGMTPDKPYRKCARIVGDVMGKYHPHGDSSIYDALVRLAQKFNMRYTLVDGQGNFGSMDGDGAAAQRYTECKMQKITMEMVRDINKETVDFIPNYDQTESEPVTLPSRFPNLLVNGSMGIAVGMATNIPPHNLRETIDGVTALIDNPDISVLELMQYIKGPDFPTGGIIYGTTGIREAYETGRGKLIIRAKAEIVEEKGKFKIEVTEIPYSVNKAKLVEQIALLVKDKRITGISGINDLSDRNGLKISIDLKKDANPQIVLNQLYKLSKLQETFGVIMLALVGQKPKILNLKEMLFHYLNHQKDVVTRRSRYDLRKAEEKAHILEGLIKALDIIDEVIRTIREADSPLTELMERFGFTEIQANAILEMKLRRLGKMERSKLDAEYAELQKLMQELREILGSEKRLLEVIKEELNDVRHRYGDDRRTQIEKHAEEINYEDLINEEAAVITITESGYIKRTSADTYTSQKRGGRGIQAMATKEDDLVTTVIVTSTHVNLLFFSNKGKVYRLKAYQIQDSGRNSKGQNLVNLLPLEPDEKIQAVRPIKDLGADGYLIMGTKLGVIKKTSLKDFANIRKNGLIALTLKDNDELLHVKATRGDADLVVVTKYGYAIKFNESQIRVMGRGAAGVKSIRLRSGDECVTLDVATPNENLLIVSENGIGKKTPIEDYPIQNRGGMGRKAYKVTKKTGFVVAARLTNDEDEIMLINSDGLTIRLNVRDIKLTSRIASGVKLMRANGETKVVSIAKVHEVEAKDKTLEVTDETEPINEEEALNRENNKISEEELLNRSANFTTIDFVEEDNEDPSSLELFEEEDDEDEELDEVNSDFADEDEELEDPSEEE